MAKKKTKKSKTIRHTATKCAGAKGKKKCTYSSGCKKEGRVRYTTRGTKVKCMRKPKSDRNTALLWRRKKGKNKGTPVAVKTLISKSELKKRRAARKK